MAAQTWVQVYPVNSDPFRISPPGLAPRRWTQKARLSYGALLDGPDTTVTEVNGGALIRRWERIR